MNLKTPLLFIELKSHGVSYCHCPEKGAELHFENFSFSAGSWQDSIESTAKEFKTFLLDSKLNYKSVVVLISANDLMQHQCALPPLNERDQYDYLNLQADQVFPIGEQDRVLCVSTQDEDVSLFALTKTLYQKLHKWLGYAELNIQGVYPRNAIYQCTKSFTGIQCIDCKSELLLTYFNAGQVMVCEQFKKDDGHLPKFEIKQSIASSSLSAQDQIWGLQYCMNNTELSSSQSLDFFQGFTSKVETSPPVWSLQESLNFLTPLSLPTKNTLDILKSHRVRQVMLLVVLVIGVFTYFWWEQSQSLSNLEVKWSSMATKVEQLQSQQDKLRTYSKWTQQTPLELRFLNMLSKAFPAQGDAWIKTIQMKTFDDIELSGIAKSSTIWLKLLKGLEKEKGFSDLKVIQIQGQSPVEFQVEFKWGLR